METLWIAKSSSLDLVMSSKSALPEAHRSKSGISPGGGEAPWASATRFIAHMQISFLPELHWNRFSTDDQGPPITPPKILLEDTATGKMPERIKSKRALSRHDCGVPRTFPRVFLLEDISRVCCQCPTGPYGYRHCSRIKYARVVPICLCCRFLQACAVLVNIWSVCFCYASLK